MTTDPVVAQASGRVRQRPPGPLHYGARTARDLFYLHEIKELGNRLVNFTFVPVLSEETGADWPSLGVANGDFGFVTDTVDRRESDLSEAEVYVCGPPPMVDAAMAMLEGKTVVREHIYFDKFTTTVHQA